MSWPLRCGVKIPTKPNLDSSAHMREETGRKGRLRASLAALVMAVVLGIAHAGSHANETAKATSLPPKLVKYTGKYHKKHESASTEVSLLFYPRSGMADPTKAPSLPPRTDHQA